MSRPRQALTSSIAPGAYRIGAPELSRIGIKRLRGADIARPFSGIRVIGDDAQSLRQRCRAFLPLMHRGDFFSHATAAQLLGVPLPGRMMADSRLHVSRVDGTRPRRAGIAAHRVRNGRTRIVSVAGMPVADAVSTWVALAADTNRDELVAAGDFMVSGGVTDGSRSPALATIAELEDAVNSRVGCRGGRVLAHALPLVRTRVDSPMESLLRLMLIDAGFPEPVINQPAYSVSGIYLGKPDLSYPWLKLSFEYEGAGHAETVQFRRDLQRYGRFDRDGWRVFRVMSLQLFDAREEFLQSVWEAYLERMRKFGFSPRSER